MIIISIFLFVVFLYWAYLPDYKRNPKEFWRTLIGMPIGMLLRGIGYPNMDEKIRNWALKKNDTLKENKKT